MELTRKLCRLIFWLTTGSLIAFCLLFGVPFLSTIAAGKVIAMAGCRPPSFDMQAICPTGSYAEPFIPLSHWFTSGFAPFVLVKNFGGLLAVWSALCGALGLANKMLSARSD
jgi:hypothetical protein